eukprot:6247257-Ditylum_brightwellii.AAC.1
MKLPEFFPLLPAKLRLFVAAMGSDESREIAVKRIPNFFWEEHAVTWSTFGGLTPEYDMVGSSVLTISQDQKGKWVEVDVSDLITDGQLTLALEGN